MSIQSEITRITTKRDLAFDAVEDKGVTVPSDSTIDDLPDLIAAIKTYDDYTFSIDANGHLILSYSTSSMSVNYSLDNNGHLILEY